jgi:hypothetical protein
MTDTSPRLPRTQLRRRHPSLLLLLLLLLSIHCNGHQGELSHMPLLQLMLRLRLRLRLWLWLWP